jgi:hypothetical protein
LKKSNTSIAVLYKKRNFRGSAVLNIQKVIEQVQKSEQQLFFVQQNIQESLVYDWQAFCADRETMHKAAAKKYGVLVPRYTQPIDKVHDVPFVSTGYSVLAVDGSQIYYDRHQGPACYVINTGAVYISYQQPRSVVEMDNQPHVFPVSGQEEKAAAVVDAAREIQEIKKLTELALRHDAERNFVALFDGTIVWQGEYEDESSQVYAYLGYLEQLYQKGILWCGYVSFPKSRELANLFRLWKVEFHEDELSSLSAHFLSLTDRDIVELYLQNGQRSIVFEHRSPVSYIYPGHLKPYFCYVHVGKEIARIEIPAWIAADQEKLDHVCAVVYDQAQKGDGYPVVLFEAHEQAVIKQQDKMMFYHILYSMTQQKNQAFQASQKSIKKRVISI